MKAQRRLLPSGPDENEGWIIDAQAEEESPLAGLERLHRIFRGRYALAIVLGLAGGIGCGVAGWYATQPKYVSEGYIQVRTTLPMILYRTEQSSPMSGFYEFVNSQAKFLESRRVIDRAMSSARWKALGRGSTPEMVQEFEDSLEVLTSRQAGEWITIKFADLDPKAAQIGVSETIRAYEDVYQDEEWFDTPEKKIAKLLTREEELNRQIKSLDDEKRALEAAYLSSDLTALYRQRLDLLGESRNQLTELTRLKERVESTAASHAEAADDWASEESVMAIAQVDPVMRSLLERQSFFELELVRLEANGLREQHREVRQRRADLEAVRQQINRRAEDWSLNGTLLPGSDVSQLADPEAIGAQIATLEEGISRQKQYVQKLGEDRRKYEQVSDDLAAAKSNLAEVRQRLVELQVERPVLEDSQSGISERINVVSYGEVPVRPGVDSRRKYAAFGALLGGGAPIGLLFLLGLLDRRVKYCDQAMDYSSHVPLLGVLPNLPKNLQDPEQAAIAAHCVHQIRTLLQITGSHTDRRVITVTSPTAGDGKTSLALSLGLSFASAGTRTLLIDFDLIGCGLSHAMGSRDGPSVTDALRNGQIAAHTTGTGVERLTLLPSRAQDHNLIPELNPTVVRKLIADARQRYEMVLIDTGPILGSIEASLAAAESDGVILTLGRGQQRADASRALGHLVSLGAKVVGFVFNRAGETDFRRSLSSGSIRSSVVSSSQAIVRAGKDRSGGFGPIADSLSTGKDAPANEG